MILVEPDAAAADLRSRWLHLIRTVLPSLARLSNWPIRDDHRFMRVCLDAAPGRR